MQCDVGNINPDKVFGTANVLTLVMSLVPGLHCGMFPFASGTCCYEQQSAHLRRAEFKHLHVKALVGAPLTTLY